MSFSRITLRGVVALGFCCLMAASASAQQSIRSQRAASRLQSQAQQAMGAGSVRGAQRVQPSSGERSGMARQQATLQQGAERAQQAGGLARFGMNSMKMQQWRPNAITPRVARGGSIPSQYKIRSTGHYPRFMDSSSYFDRGPE
jgi:hypothetical protein